MQLLPHDEKCFDLLVDQAKIVFEASRLGAWDQAGFKAQEAGDEAAVAKEAYKEGLRNLDYEF